MAKTIPYIDLFCGAGGLSAGFQSAGFRAAFANDYDEFACETYAHNHPKCVVHHGDVAGVNGAEIAQAVRPDIPLIIGGPNCQGVSLRGKRNPDDPKNQMFFHFKRIINDVRPEWFVMENVPGLLHRHNRELLTRIFREFDDIGYRCAAEVLLAADYGVPQLRYRLVLVGTRTTDPIEFPDPTHAWPAPKTMTQAQLFSDGSRNLPPWETVASAIRGLPRLKNGGGGAEADYEENSDGDFRRWLCNGEAVLFNHQSHKTGQNNIDLIRHIPAGGNWRDIPEELRPGRFKHVALKDHTTTYGRLAWDSQARTITTYFNNISAGAFTHPTQSRGISVREGARLQSFKDGFRFFGPLSRQYRQVGNAVPPLLAHHVARLIRRKIQRPGKKKRGAHAPAVVFDTASGLPVTVRPVKGMRFNLDKHLVTT